MAKEKSYGSRFLYAEDLLIDGEFKTFDLVISEFHPKGTIKTDQGRESKLIDKPSIGFEKTDKLLVLCKTNRRILHYLTGYGQEDGEMWVGTVVKLQPRYVEAFGSTVPALRIIPPVGSKLPLSVIKRLGEEAVFAKGE